MDATIPYAVGVGAICVTDRVSWTRRSDGRRQFGHVHSIHGGFIIAISDHGIRYALRPREVTKEEC